ncbi:uncharacterized protein [Medicago truncatula]|uniref:uncharacterized protein n=1 Tax=Medicago truncatula TaxID=3880 RepID=UPI001966DE36|nr:uncharacterized protein LOC11417952 [Medicago truncatula]
MPMLLGTSEPRRDLTVDEIKDDVQKNLVETMIVQACNTLSYCAVRSSINFSPHIGEVATMFMRLLGCSNSQLRKASILGLPNLVISLKVCDKTNDAKRGITFWIVRALIEISKKEKDSVLFTTLLRLLARCIQICSSFFNDQMIKVIANVIKASIQKISQIQVRKTQELGTLEGRPVILPTEDTLQLCSDCLLCLAL